MWFRGFISIIINPFLRVFAISAFLKVIHAPKTPKRGGISGTPKITFPHIFFQILGRLFSGYLKWEVLGAWMTFKKAEMAKTLKNGLSMIEMNPLNHNWSHFVILLGLTLHQFQKKLLLRDMIKKIIRLSSAFS